MLLQVYETNYAVFLRGLCSNLIFSISIGSNLRKRHSGRTNDWDNQSHSRWTKNKSAIKQEY